MQIYTTKKFSYENILSETAGGNLPVQSQKGVLHDPSQKIILIKIIVIIIKNSKIMEGFQIKKSPFPGSPSTPVLNQMPQQVIIPHVQITSSGVQSTLSALESI